MKKMITFKIVLAVLTPVWLFASEPDKKLRDDLTPSFSLYNLKENLVALTVQELNYKNEENKNPNLLQEKTIVKRSRGRAFLQSLILPGWGQYYAGSRTMTQVFMVSEAFVWSSYIGLSTWSNWLENDYRTFASNHAGVSPKGKNANYFIDIGNFDDIFAYNQAQLRDRDLNDFYTDTENFFWRWDLAANREKYDDIRIRSDRAKNRAEFALAGIFLNHLVSAIHSTLAVYRHNKHSESKKEIGIRMNLNYENHNPGITVQLAKHF